jgi:predicted TIM-barrel fold metal-dependent hydrolase
MAGAQLPLDRYRPRPMVRRELTELGARPPAPIIDVHNHLGRWLTGGWSAPDLGAMLATMDEAGVEMIVNLDGMWGDELEANLDRYDRGHPDRFVTFAQWDRSLIASGEWDELGRQAASSFAAGAKGLKVWKDLGLHLRDPAGSLVMPDDARLDPVWDAVAAAGVPVTIHVADPIAFFEPVDEHNERLEELTTHPDWWFGDRDQFPAFDELLDRLESLIAHRTDVTWIGAHVLCAAEDPAWVGRMLETYPNVVADLAARVAEIGRAPRAWRAVIVRHPSRFLLGTDEFPPNGEVYAVYRRVLETADEAFAYDTDADAPPSQGRWTVSGLDLPADVVASVYGTNARRILGMRPGTSVR